MERGTKFEGCGRPCAGGCGPQCGVNSVKIERCVRDDSTCDTSTCVSSKVEECCNVVFTREQMLYISQIAGEMMLQNNKGIDIINSKVDNANAVDYNYRQN